MGEIIITGVSGQDGSYMVDYLLENTNHNIYGGVRRLSVKNHQNIKHINHPRFKLIDLDVTDPVNITGVIRNIKPDYFINLAANSFVGSSWEMPINHYQTNALAVLHQLEAIRQYCPSCRYYNAGSSEEFGDVQYSPQDEKHPLRPRSPYGAAKASARHLVKVYRESFDLYAVQGWLFNHESERRGEEFVTRKITKGIARIAHQLDLEKHMVGVVGGIKPLNLGNLDAKRDWSHAEDFVYGIWLMMNQNEPKDYVLSSNETHSVRDFVNAALEQAGISGEWTGKGINEKFVHNGKVLVEVNPQFYRPAEVELLLGDSTKARDELMWEPQNDFKTLVSRMYDNDKIKV